MALTRVLITVKTYPSISRKYGELVCTAGITQAGKWIRIYPVQFRDLDYTEQYGKYDWIDIDLVRNEKDFRPESHRPVTAQTQPKFVGEINTKKDGWEQREKIVLNHVVTDMKALVEDARNPQLYTSLATFKPSEILDFKWKEVSRDWPAAKKAVMRQLNLFEKRGSKLDIIKKIPYKFTYLFKDENGKISQMMIEDWEIGALYWNCLKRADGDEKIACQKVALKYLDDHAATKNLHFFLGTTKAFHMKARNPFVIIGTFYPPFHKINPQLSLGF